MAFYLIDIRVKCYYCHVKYATHQICTSGTNRLMECCESCGKRHVKYLNEKNLPSPQ